MLHFCVQKQVTTDLTQFMFHVAEDDTILSINTWSAGSTWIWVLYRSEYRCSHCLGLQLLAESGPVSSSVDNYPGCVLAMCVMLWKLQRKWPIRRLVTTTRTGIVCCSDFSKLIPRKLQQRGAFLVPKGKLCPDFCISLFFIYQHHRKKN